MGDLEFDARLDQMRRVLEVVAAIEGNADLQSAAFAHMFGHSTWHSQTPEVPIDLSVGEDEGAGDVGGAAEASSGGKKPRVKRASKSPNVTVDKNLDTSPEGVQPWKVFAAEKRPTTNSDRNLAAVYWLKETAGHDRVNASKVLTLFLDVDWRAPADPKNSLQVTASQSGLIDTSDMEDVKVAPRGISRVRTDLPLPEKTKK